MKQCNQCKLTVLDFLFNPEEELDEQEIQDKEKEVFFSCQHGTFCSKECHDAENDEHEEAFDGYGNFIGWK